ncbi:MAG: PHP domain-containing protein [Defluviitaleaceae bacterium]|nr:PHP domain-containing protein [Defluviitaleaceae bacterium]
MKKFLFNNDKNIYKANMHSHTTVSDGTLTPEQAKEAYIARGYNIIAFTDHNLLMSQQHLNDENFLAINACEVNINEENKRGLATYHLNLYATRPDITDTPPMPEMDYLDHEAINKYIAERNAEGFLVCYNHPYWSMQTHAEYSKLRGLFAMEIYNHNCEVDEGYYGYNPQVYDEMLRQGQNIFCFSTDDNHNWGPKDMPDRDSFGGFIRINSKSLTYADVMDALIKGDFYASQAPEIHEISLDENILTVRCSPAELVVIYTQGRRCYTKKGEGITEAKFELSGNDDYIRVMCRDKNKLDANSNAYWIK